MEYSNAQKLAAVVSKWARPAISQIATKKVIELPGMKSLRAAIVGSGIVGSEYSLTSDLQPFFEPIINMLIEPMIYQYVSKVPDASIPMAARSIVDKMMEMQCFSILDGLITFEQEDIIELDDMIKRNMPLCNEEKYEPI